MSNASQFRIRFERLMRRAEEAKLKTAKAKSQFDHARAHEIGIDHELDEARAELDSLVEATRPPGVPVVSSPVPKAKLDPVHVPTYLREVLSVFPPSGIVTLAAIRAGLGLPDSTINTRIQRAKKLGVLTISGRAEYRLTDLGERARDSKLKAVGSGS